MMYPPPPCRLPNLQAAEPAGPVSNTGRDYRIALTKTKTPAGADPAAVTMTGAKENRPLCSRKMPDSDEAMIHLLHLIS